MTGRSSNSDQILVESRCIASASASSADIYSTARTPAISSFSSSSSSFRRLLPLHGSVTLAIVPPGPF